MIKRGSKEAFKRNMRERPRYVVEHADGSKHPFRTKKEIIEAYGLNYGRVNQSLNHYFEWFKDNNIYIRVRYHTCKDCPDYMLESANCKECIKDMDL